jgi:predicted DNA-binding transcriptional regulator AlpA
MSVHTPSNSTISDALKHFDSLPDSASVRLPVLLGLYACSPASIWRGVAANRIPKPRKLSPRTTCWNVGELRAALAAKTAV